MHLSREEVSQLLNTRIVALSPRGGDGEYEISAGSVVGTVVLPSLRLLIRPKVALQNVFFLLGYGAGITQWTPEPFPFDHEPDFLNAVAWVFEAEVRRALPRGVVRGYQHREETLATLRGRLDIASQIRTRQGKPFPLECRFDEYTEDITLNRVLKAAHDWLLNGPSLDLKPSLGIRANRRAFAEVASVGYSPAHVPEVAFTRLNRQWQAAGLLARLILQQRTLRDREGTIAGISFTVDMNQLFERFVEQVVRAAAEQAGWELVAQGQRRLTPQVMMRPDLVLRDRGRDRAVADAKYKEPDEGWYHSDLYQLLAYCAALGLPRGLLIYGGPRPLERQAVERTGIHLELVGIDLTASPQAILRQAGDVAAHFIRQAAA